MLLPPVVYYGSKSQFLRRLSRHVPLGGKPYCEPYSGGASLLFARPPAPVEVLNDLDESIVNLFRCLQDENLYKQLAHRLRFTLYSYSEFKRALAILAYGHPDPVLRAWALMVKASQMFCTGPKRHMTGWARTLQTSGNVSKKCSQWITRLSMLEDWHQRLLLVQLECRDALEVIQYWDNPDAVFYLDPPYLHDTRDKSSQDVYAIEATLSHYNQLISLLLNVQGSVTLSGYEHPIYTPLLESGWSVAKYTSVIRLTRITDMRSKKSRRTECIFMNPRCQELLRANTLPMFPPASSTETNQENMA